MLVLFSSLTLLSQNFAWQSQDLLPSVQYLPHLEELRAGATMCSDVVELHAEIYRQGDLHSQLKIWAVCQAVDAPSFLYRMSYLGTTATLWPRSANI